MRQLIDGIGRYADPGLVSRQVATAEFARPRDVIPRQNRFASVSRRLADGPARRYDLVSEPNGADGNADGAQVEDELGAAVQVDQGLKLVEVESGVRLRRVVQEIRKLSGVVRHRCTHSDTYRFTLCRVDDDDVKAAAEKKDTDQKRSPNKDRWTTQR